MRREPERTYCTTPRSFPPRVKLERNDFARSLEAGSERSVTAAPFLGGAPECVPFFAAMASAYPLPRRLNE